MGSGWPSKGFFSATPFRLDLQALSLQTALKVKKYLAEKLSKPYRSWLTMSIDSSSSLSIFGFLPVQKFMRNVGINLKNPKRGCCLKFLIKNFNLLINKINLRSIKKKRVGKWMSLCCKAVYKFIIYPITQLSQTKIVILDSELSEECIDFTCVIFIFFVSVYTRTCRNDDLIFNFSSFFGSKMLLFIDMKFSIFFNLKILYKILHELKTRLRSESFFDGIKGRNWYLPFFNRDELGIKKGSWDGTFFPNFLFYPNNQIISNQIDITRVNHL
ncbi:Uncharacterized protein FWK35_00011373 [Aphis craccivora]|uniref:Uncharacterized protein n=1 Tax=Aphis craccivora TaxID=307492 RepID=A0A6G0Y3V5_APHCR|nr:Uncharacterized protein FWK35_00011373 [Aphis craccivora]